MKFIIIFLGILVMTVTTTVQATEINIKITGVNVKRGGDIIVMIFGEEGFPKIHRKALASQAKRATKSTLEFNFTLNTLKNNELAVKVLHDENGDGRVTKNWTGIYPKEGLGFSNGQRISMTGPPVYKKSKVSREQFKAGLIIPVRYP